MAKETVRMHNTLLSFSEFLAFSETLPPEVIQFIQYGVSISTDGLLIADAREQGFPIMYASQAFSALTGYSQQEIIGRSCSILQGIDTNPDTVNSIRDALKTGQSFKGELRNYRKDGTLFWNLLRIEPIYIENELRYFIGIQTDITSLKETQEQLYRIENIFNHSDDLMFLVDTAFHYVEVNDACQEAFGKQRHEIIGKHIKDVHDEALFQERKPGLERAFKGEFVVTQVRPPNTDRIFDVHVSPYYNQQSQIIGAVVIIRDISRLLETQEALTRYEVILSHSSDLMALAGHNGRYLAINDAYVKMFGVPREDILGKHVFEFIHEDLVDIEKTERLKYFNLCLEGETQRYQHWIYPPDAEARFLDVKLVPFRDNDGTIIGVVISTRDITDFKNTQIRLELANALIAQSSDRISIVDRNYRYIFTNANIRHYEKPQPENLIGLHLRDVIGDEAFESRVKGYMARCFQGERINYQSWFTPTTYVDILMEPYRDENGFIMGAIFLLRDITQTHQAQLALQASETRFRDFAEIAADFFWETNAEHTLTYLSEQQAIVTQYPTELWLHRPLLDFLEVLIPDATTKEQQWQAIQNHQVIDTERSFKRLDGETRVVRTVAKPVFDEQGAFKGYRGIGRDVTQSHELAKQLEYQATYDALTGLVNRREFDLRLDGALRMAREHNQQHVLCYLDLDQFKIVNDTVGHVAGDELLKQVSAILQPHVRASDTLARLGGDEFAVLLNNCPLATGVTIAENLIKELRDYSFNWQGRRFKISASIGVIEITAKTHSREQLMSQADVACYAAKDQGRNRVHAYRTDGHSTNKHHAELMRVNDIRSGLQNKRFRLYYQTILPLNNDNQLLPYYEVLLRLNDKDGNVVSPGTFIPAAERYNLMNDIDKFVIQQTLVTQQDLFNQLPYGYIAINLSGTSLNDPDLLNYVKTQFKHSSLAPERICFEITETAVISNLGEALLFIEAMRTLGCKFALDDFGSGLSSFAYLKRFDVDFLKIDGYLVRDMSTDYADQVMVRAINEIGQAMNIHTIAEFVETQTDIELLKKLHVTYAQGYAISRPLPLESLKES